MGQWKMSWTEMEKKARNHVVLRGDVDGNTLFKELKAKEKKEEEKVSPR